MKKIKSIKPKKLDSIPKINRRLFKLWSLYVKKIAGDKKCEYCGKMVGEIGSAEKPITKIDTHHIISRTKKDSFLKFDIHNGIAVCPSCHKFGEDSFHRSPVTTIDWLIQKQKYKFDYILKNFNIKVNLQNRQILAEIEDKLTQQIPFDIEKLVQLDNEIKIKEIEDEKIKSASLFELNTSTCQ